MSTLYFLCLLIVTNLYCPTPVGGSKCYVSNSQELHSPKTISAIKQQECTNPEVEPYDLHCYTVTGELVTVLVNLQGCVVSDQTCDDFFNEQAKTLGSNETLKADLYRCLVCSHDFCNSKTTYTMVRKSTGGNSSELIILTVVFFFITLAILVLGVPPCAKRIKKYRRQHPNFSANERVSV